VPSTRGGFLRDDTTGALVVTGAYPAGVTQPSDHGRKAWSAPLATVSGANAPSAATAYWTRVPILDTFTVASVKCLVNQAGTGATPLAGVFFSVNRANGTRMGISADQATALATGGEKTVNITVDGGQTLAVTPLELYVWVGLAVATQATTPVTIRGAYSAGAAVANVGLTAPNLLSGSQGGTIGASFTPASMAANSHFWYGLVGG